MRERPVLQVGDDLFDDRVPAVVGLGLQRLTTAWTPATAGCTANPTTTSLATRDRPVRVEPPPACLCLAQRHAGCPHSCAARRGRARAHPAGRGRSYRCGWPRARADESATVRRHATAVLHLLWVGGPQLGINPEDWPAELADTVLAAARRADVPVLVPPVTALTRQTVERLME